MTTLWGSWISCEETTQLADAVHRKMHGFNFEVPARMQRMVEPLPLKSMDRFSHEAIAVDPATGIVYQTEDRGDGLIYRFVPQRRGQLAGGGRLQGLKIIELPGVDTSNWKEQSIPVGQRFNVQWIDLHDVESPDDSLRKQGTEAGAARFSRGEGMWAGHGVIYFACTSGGHAKAGQIWKYIPSRFEGTSREGEKPGSVELFIEPNDRMLMENVGVTPAGVLFEFANNAMNTSEFARRDIFTGWQHIVREYPESRSHSRDYRSLANGQLTQLPTAQVFWIATVRVKIAGTLWRSHAPSDADSIRSVACAWLSHSRA